MSESIRTIHIMSGCPGCGKSTYIAEYMDYSSDIVLSRDCLRDRIRELVRSDQYFPVASKAEFVLWSNFIFNSITQFPKNDVWIDQTTINIDSFRKLWRAISPALEGTVYNLIVHCFDIPLEEIQRRNANRSGRGKVDRQTIENFYDKADLTQQLLDEFGATLDIIRN